jgi:hypothetical protein
MTQMRQFLREMSTIPLGRVEDRGARLGWEVLDEGRPRLVDESTVLIDEDIVFGDRATALEAEGIAPEETILGKRLARKAWVRCCWGVSPCTSNKLTPAMFIFLTQAAFIPRDSVSSYGITCPAQSERRKGVAEQLSQPRMKPDDSDGRKDPSGSCVRRP